MQTASNKTVRSLAGALPFWFVVIESVLVLPGYTKLAAEQHYHEYNKNIQSSTSIEENCNAIQLMTLLSYLGYNDSLLRVGYKSLST